MGINRKVVDRNVGDTRVDKTKSVPLDSIVT
jgi:hypothetical protein